MAGGNQAVGPRRLASCDGMAPGQTIDRSQSRIYAKHMKESFLLAVSAIAMLTGTAHAADGYERAAEVLAKYAMEYIPSKKGMVEASLASVAYEWLKDHVWTPPKPGSDNRPPPATNPPPVANQTTPPDFDTARNRACRDPSLNRETAPYLGCPGTSIPYLKSGDINIKADPCEGSRDREACRMVIYCSDAPLGQLSECMAQHP
jgi:hypothetical protein